MVRYRKQFTDEEIETLQKNKFVNYVSSTNVVFTEEFKAYFVKRYNEGARVPSIFAECGFDTEMLGKPRMHGVRTRLIGSVSGFKLNKIRNLENEIIELRKRVEALEKLHTHE